MTAGLDRATPGLKLRGTSSESWERSMRAAIIGLLLAGLCGPAVAQTTTPQPGAPPALADADLRALLETARESAKAARENADYARVVPDILTQILAKLDKIEDKLDKVENAIKGQAGERRGTRR